MIIYKNTYIRDRHKDQMLSRKWIIILKIVFTSGEATCSDLFFEYIRETPSCIKLCQSTINKLKFKSFKC